MLTKSQLMDAIDELETSCVTYQDCEKLATFYSLYDHLYGSSRPVPNVEMLREVTIAEYGGSDFLRSISGKDADAVWQIMDEVMDTVRAFQPRLYDATLQKIRG